MSESFLNDRVVLHPGDCLDVLARLEENSIDSCVTDPPYHLVSIYKRFANEARNGATVGKHAYGRHARGFMGKRWDGGDITFKVETWKRVFRVLKPGAHLLAFGGTRTYHRMACAIEDAGFEIRDCVMWVYGSGFPKSLDVSKALDKAAGAEREIIGRRIYADGHVQNSSEDKLAPPIGTFVRSQDDRIKTAPATDAACQWSGFGTALKPACEPIVLARKPLSESTVAANVLKWGTGALNIDGCRVGMMTREEIARSGASTGGYSGGFCSVSWKDEQHEPQGRWPANLIHDGSEEVVEAFPDAPGQQAAVRGNEPSNSARYIYGGLAGRHSPREPVGDAGSAARFFYTAKADSDDRLGSKHPTVKPLDLMQYLVRLVTPPRGLVLDPFAGTGTTGEAAWREGMRAVLIEREDEYLADIRRRMALALAGPDERTRETIKARGLTESPGPLFDQYDGARDFEQSITDCYRAVKDRVAEGGPSWPKEAAE